MTLTDRGPDDMLQVAELQQKLEVSGAWAYELERDVADLSVEVEGLRDVCVQLQHTLDCKSQELAGPPPPPPPPCSLPPACSTSAPPPRLRTCLARND